MKSVCYIVSTTGACDYYRAELPWRTAKKNGVDVRRFARGDGQKSMEKALAADVILFQRVENEETLAVMADLKRQGKRVVVDYDDNLFCISPFSPHYEELGTEEVVVNVAGEEVKLWQDGVNGFNTERNKHRLECVKAAVTLADVVTVTTEILASVYREYNTNVHVLPNCVDPELWKRLPLKDDGLIRLYWSGGASHFEDFALLTAPLTAIMHKYPETRLVVMGQHFKGSLAGIPADRLELHSWVDTAAYPYKSRILNPSISLIPLVENEFNECKSSLKMVEQSMLGTPSIVSYVSPYKEDYNGHNAVMVKDNTNAGWHQALEALINDPLLRAKMGEEARKAAIGKYDINNNWQKWVTAYGLD